MRVSIGVAPNLMIAHYFSTEDKYRQVCRTLKQQIFKNTISYEIPKFYVGDTSLRMFTVLYPMKYGISNHISFHRKLVSPTASNTIQWLVRSLPHVPPSAFAYLKVNGQYITFIFTNIFRKLYSKDFKAILKLLVSPYIQVVVVNLLSRN